jgi:uncharacterized protein YbaR (Trm112 family)
MKKINLTILKNLKNRNFFLYLKRKYKYLDNETINLLSYDRQAGSYIKQYNNEKNKYYNHCRSLYEEMHAYLRNGSSLLEAGTGECVTLLPLAKIINKEFKNINYLGFDFSFSRLLLGKYFLQKNNLFASLFCSNMNNIGLVDNCVDIVFSNHGIEPNGGQEETILKEMLRISNKYVFLFEPIYELNPKKNRIRMNKFGYVKNLYNICKKLDCSIIKYELLNSAHSRRSNLTGVIILKKKISRIKQKKFKCLITNFQLEKKDGFYYNKNPGILYPIVKSIPLLLDKSAIMCSKI